jgi:hypothetical protein
VGSGGATRNSDAIESSPDTAAASHRVERALARLATERSSRVDLTREGRPPPGVPAMSAGRPASPLPTVAPDRPFTDATAAAARASAGAPAAPLQAGRVGGFRGLAALGMVAGQAPGPAAVAPAVTVPGAARPQPAILDPQTVIDHVESALREQAARSGISIEGLEP